ncbi:hypothetical protein Tco_1334260 [Tanacetum coccineum]
MVSSLPVDEPVVAARNTKDANVGHTPISSIVDQYSCTSYANLFTSESSRKSVNFRTLITPVGNRTDVVVSLESIKAISERTLRVKVHGVPVTVFSKDGLSAIATKLDTPLMLDFYTSDMCMQSWGKSSYARSMIELRADVELKDTIVVAMPKLVREGFYACNIRIEYEWKPPRYACCKVFGHVQDECPKKIGSDVAKNMKNPNQAPRGVLVGPKLGYKPVKQVYRHVSKKNNVNTSGNKKKDEESRKEVSNPNPFDVLNSFENDVDNVGSSIISTTLIVEKFDKLEKLIIDGKITLVDDEGKPLEKVDYLGDHDSEDEVKPVDNEMTSFLASERVDYVLIVYWNNGGKLMRMLITTMTHTIMICMKSKKFLTIFNLYAITWISSYEVIRRYRLLEISESFVVQSLYASSFKKVGCLCNEWRYGIHPHPLYLIVF